MNSQMKTGLSTVGRVQATRTTLEPTVGCYGNMFSSEMVDLNG